MKICVVVGTIIIVFLLFLLMKANTKENYGGPVKRIHRIPLNTCYDTCQQYYSNCMAQYQYIDATDCSRRYENCMSVCRYSDFQRL